MPLTNETAVKMTTARYFTPSGRSIQAEGIVPDITMAAVKVSNGDDNSFALLREQDLTKHLDNPNAETEKPVDATPAKSTDEDTTPLAVKDYALSEALNLLKGINILNPRP